MIKRCKRCGKPFDALSGRYQYCALCKEIVKDEKVQEWWRKHPDYKKEYFKPLKPQEAS